MKNRNIRLIIEYNGTQYKGWQYQPDLPTIQGILEETLKNIVNEKVNVIVAGRTDSGVHALQQVTNFKTDSRIEASKLKLALNSILPHDIRVMRADDVSISFNSRKDAMSKTYMYLILNRDNSSALLGPFSWFIPLPLDIDAMKKAMKFLRGEHDFSSFKSSQDTSISSVRKIYSLKLIERKQIIVFFIKASGFLHHMVRNIMGTLVEVGRRKLTPEDFKLILEAKNRKLAGKTAPARGLFLLSVRYPDSSRRL